jgi:polyisoprenoid-binding protein YceI
VRDDKIRYLADFLDARRFPAIRFRSDEIEPAGDERNFRLTGILTCRGVEKRVRLDARFNGFGRSALYGLRMGFSAATTLDRRDFGITTVAPSLDATLPLDDSAGLLGWKLNVEIQVEVVLANDEGKYKW